MIRIKSIFQFLIISIIITGCIPSKQIMEANQLIDNFKNDKLITKGGALVIWGTSFGKIGDNFYEISNITFDKNQNKLTIETSYVKAEIWNPESINEVPSKNEFWPPSIQIENANRVRLEYNFENKDYFIDFNYDSKKINSNSDWYKNGTIKDTEKPALVVM